MIFYTFDAEQQIVNLKVRDRVSLEELVISIDRILDDPSFKEDMDWIIDTLGIAAGDLQLAPDTVNELSLKLAPPDSEKMIAAVVDPTWTELAHEVVGGANPRLELAIFDTVAAAEMWIVDARVDRVTSPLLRLPTGA